MDLRDAVTASLKDWGVEDSAMAAAALDLVGRLEDPKVAPYAAAQLHRELREALVRLQALAPPQVDADDPVDEVKRKRDERRGA